MQITIVAGGSRGDVQPYIALGTGLQEAGHRIRILSSDDFHDLAADHSLEFFKTGSSSEAVAQSMQALVEQGKMLQVLSKMRRASRQQAVQAAEAGMAACQNSDLILGGLGGVFSGVALSEKMHIPFMPAYLVPFTPTAAFPGALTPILQTPLTRWLNRPSHRLAQQIMWQSFRSADNKARVEALHLPPSRFWGPFSLLERQKGPILYGYSPQVISTPGDWSDSIHVTGYWFLEPRIGWEPPGDLVNFLRSGPPPVYIGFGSMSSSKPEETADLALRALALTGQRGILSSGWGGLKKTVCLRTSL